jgi:hypothetical protein
VPRSRYKPPAGFIEREEGSLWIREEMARSLDEAGLPAFADLMATEKGQTLRERGYSTNIRISIDGRDHYLKRHRYPRLGVALRGGIKGNPARLSGKMELLNLLGFRDRGIGTCVPVAAGDRVRGRWGETFILTEGISSQRSLEEIVPDRYRPPLDDDRRREKKRLILALGRWVRSLHASGLHVRDLYLCHIFAPPGDPTDDFRLIDLHRARIGLPIGRRRIVRDLAALHHSAPRTIITRADRVRFLRECLGVPRLDPRARSLVRRVTARAWRMERHESGQGRIWGLIHAGVPPLRP